MCQQLVKATVASLALAAAVGASSLSVRAWGGPGTDAGTLVSGFPVSSAVRAGDLVYLFSLDLSPARIVAYDPVAGRVAGKPVAIPHGSRIWATEVIGAVIYFGAWGTGSNPNLFSFNTETNTLRTLGHIPGDGEFWTLASDGEGRLYAGTRKPNVVFQIDPRETPAAITPLPFAHDLADESGTVYRDAGGGVLRHQVTSLAWREGKLLVGLGRELARVLEVDPENPGATRDLTPPLIRDHKGVHGMQLVNGELLIGTEAGPANQAFFLRGKFAGDREETTVEWAAAPVPAEGLLRVFAPTAEPGTYLAAGTVTGSLFNVTVSAIGKTPPPVTEHARPFPHSPIRALFAEADGFLGVSAAPRVWKINDRGDVILSDGLIGEGEGRLSGEPVRAQSAILAAGHVVAGGNNVVQTRLLAGKTNAEPVRIAIPGEPKALATDGRTVYAAIYPTGQLWAFEPGDPASLRKIADWDNDANRPYAALWHDGKVYVAVKRDTGARFGVVLAIDPAQADPARAVVDFADRAGGGDTPSRHPHSLATDGRHLYVGSNGATPVFSVRDLTNLERELWRLAGDDFAPGAGHAQAMVVWENQIHALTARGWWIVIDLEKRKVVHRGQVIPGGAGHLEAVEGRLLAVGPNHLVEIDPDTRENRVLVEGLRAQSHLKGGNIVLTEDDGSVLVLGGPHGPRNLTRFIR